MNIRKYFFVNRNIKTWNQLPTEALETFPCKPNIFKKGVKKAIIKEMKWKEENCGDKRLKVQWSEVRWSVVMWDEMERKEI